MSINKVNYLDDHGTSTLLEELFTKIGDNYIRNEQVDDYLDPVSTNPVENRAIYQAFMGKEDKVYQYGFEMDLDESQPDKMITYIGKNANFSPAYMDYAHDTFYYGDWSDVWFIKDLKVVMMKYDGTVDYELDPNNYLKKKGTNTASAANSDSYGGNVMVGIPTVWIKIDTTHPRKPRFWFAPEQINSSYHAFAHTNSVGDIMPYTYMAAYDAWKDSSSRLRSISGKVPTRSETGTNQITECRANNLSGATIWDLHTLVDHELITLLLMLIGRSTDSQTVFGYGNGNGYNSHATGSDTNGVLSSGTMDTKGLFYGYSASTATNLGVKVFGIEHFWGNIWKRTQGLINDNGTMKYKLTRGTHDGSTVSDYNTTGSGYLTAGTLTNITSGSFITDMYVGNFGLLPKSTDTTTGSASTYYCDKVWVNNSQVNFALFGGDSAGGSSCGSCCYALHLAVGGSNWNFGAALSCKPLNA